jgi:hypothetical protein
MSKTEHYYKRGMLAPIFQIRRNLNIWTEIANSIDILYQTDKETQKLFSFIQLAAQDNFVLGTCRLFDRPNKRNETLCILNFLKIIEGDKSLNLRKSWEFQHKFDKFSYPELLIQKIKMKPNESKQHFLDYYKALYQSDKIQENLHKIQFVRDKFVGHNELILNDFNFHPSIVIELIDFAEELMNVFNELFIGEIYVADPIDQNAFFIKKALKKLIIQ